MSQFYVNQRVVCVDAGSPGIGLRAPLRQDAVYVVKAIGAVRCCGGEVLDVGIPSKLSYAGCTYCNLITPKPHGDPWWMRASRFRPIEEADLTAQIARDWKESVPVEQEHVNLPEPLPA